MDRHEVALNNWIFSCQKMEKDTRETFSKYHKLCTNSKLLIKNCEHTSMGDPKDMTPLEIAMFYLEENIFLN